MYRRTPATTCTLWPVASSAVLGPPPPLSPLPLPRPSDEFERSQRRYETLVTLDS
jgi:hypothetical protein